MQTRALFSQKGGTGKTTRAVHLAVAATEAGVAVASGRHRRHRPAAQRDRLGARPPGTAADRRQHHARRAAPGHRGRRA